MSKFHRIVVTGTWLYDGTLQKPVWIVAMNYDFWHDLYETDGCLEPGETPRPLSADGVLYYATFRALGDHGAWPHGHGFTTLAAAKRYAESKVQCAVSWEDNPASEPDGLSARPQ